MPAASLLPVALLLLLALMLQKALLALLPALRLALQQETLGPQRKARPASKLVSTLGLQRVARLA